MPWQPKSRGSQHCAVFRSKWFGNGQPEPGWDTVRLSTLRGHRSGRLGTKELFCHGMPQGPARAGEVGSCQCKGQITSRNGESPTPEWLYTSWQGS